jgi:predicted RNA-binding Zn ribbon-like protein
MIAGAICLDFVNTLGGLRGARTEEQLRTYADLLNWSHQAGILSAGTADRLLGVAQGDEADVVMARAVALREALYGIFTRLLDGAEPTRADIEVLNTELSRSLAHMALAYTPEEGFAWRWIGEESALDGMLWPVTRSAADLLLLADVQSLRQCDSPTCGWLFLDLTKNHSRRWCDMRGCGNRAKVQRHRARKRSDLAAAGEA